MDPIVTVVVTSYNEERFLPDALANLARSTFADRMELLVVDDCSDKIESVQAAVRAVQGSFAAVRLVRMRRNVGLSGSRNLGLDLARGRFVNFHDGDDLWLDGWETGAKLLDGDPELVGLGTACRVVCETRPGKWVELAPFGHPLTKPPLDAIPRPVGGWVTWLVRKPTPLRFHSVFSRPVLHPTLALGCEDIVFWYEMLMHGKVVTEGRNLVYQKRPGGRWWRPRGMLDAVAVLAPSIMTRSGLERALQNLRDTGWDADRVSRLSGKSESEFGPVEWDEVMSDGV